MKNSSRYTIHAEAASPPFSGYPAKFKLLKEDDYVKYGHPPFADTSKETDDYWTPEIITQTWYQAETGGIPISGAGYGGRFAGKGFDGLWFDMSEIVRPTRDGIHGREYISTQVDVGGKAPALRFNPSGQLISSPPPSIGLPIPVIFNPPPMQLLASCSVQAISEAASRLRTLFILSPQDVRNYLQQESAQTALRISSKSAGPFLEQLSPGYVEIETDTSEQTLKLWSQVSKRRPGGVVGVRLPLGPGADVLAERLIDRGGPVVHFFADDQGKDLKGRYLVDALHEVHVSLVEKGLRDQVTLIASGGIAAADHVAKAIACGADLVAVDRILQVAWGCALWADQGNCAVHRKEFDPMWGAQRIVNLIKAWRDQLLEVLGAMGIREIRRLRGETGRIIRNQEEEAAFCKILGNRMSASRYPRLADGKGAGGDFRWPAAMIHATQEQARTGRPPTAHFEYRVGQSDGGFDRVAFEFELRRGSGDVPQTDPQPFDLALPLNRRDPERPELRLAVPWYGAGMSHGSISVPVMLARAHAASQIGTLVSTGEGGYPDELLPYRDQIITQVATGLFGVREETIRRAPIIEIKYAQGAKPGLGGHLLADKNTDAVARLREVNKGTTLFSPFPFHSVYSVEDHKKHVDWLKTINPTALICVKVSTPKDIDMVAVGSYYAGAHILTLDGAYGGTGAAPEIAKKSIAMPTEYAIPKAHGFLMAEGIRDEITLMASGGLRSAWDVAKAIALGADGAVIGTADLVALGCIRLGRCEKGLGCPFGITTTDPEHAKKIKPEQDWKKIFNLYTAWTWQLAGILKKLGLRSIRQLRGRQDVLVYLD